MYRDMESIQKRIEIVTRKWWFLVAFILIGMTPPIVEKGYDPSNTGTVVYYLLANSLLERVSLFYPIFKVAHITLIISLTILGGKIGRVFNLYVAVNYLLFAFLQGISITEKYGFAVLTGNVLQMTLTSIFWFLEAVIKKNSFKSPKLSLSNCWTIPLAFLAFWYPLNPETLGPDFNLSYLLTNAAGLAFCTMTPVYLTVLTIYHPNVNKMVMRVTSLTGTIIGFWNMIGNFIMMPQFWWNGVLHIPLMLISLYALALSFK
ncbi:MAG: hypothetical protein QXN75_04655 [Thermoproteota archaeon]|nr:hypothetical protein [Candidatus Brockarchaeota archaeon]